MSKRLTKRERKAVISCAKTENGTEAVFTCAQRKLDLSPNMTQTQYDRLHAASFRAGRTANRRAIQKNYGKR